MGYPDIGDYGAFRPRRSCEPRHLAGLAHPHLDHRDLMLRLQPAQQRRVYEPRGDTAGHAGYDLYRRGG